MRRALAISLVVALAALVALAPGASAPARAQGAPPGMPGMPGAGPDDHVLGGLGVAGMPAGAAEGGPAFRVREALAGGPAEGRLAADDEIVGAEKKPLAATDDVILALEAAIERAEATKTGDLELLVRRAGKTTPVKVRLAPLGAHAKTCPAKCKKCEAISGRAIEFLLSKQAADGSFPTELGGANGKLVMTALAGLALLAHGVGGGSPVDAGFTRALDFVIAQIGKEDRMGGLPGGAGGDGGGANWSQVNWQLAYGGMFLAEAAARTKRADALAKLAEVAKTLASNQESTGGWAHGPGGPNGLGYVELEIMSNYALAQLGCAQRLKAPVDKKLLAAGLKYVEECVATEGGVAYSTRPGQKGFGEAGRTAGAIVAFAMCGQRQSPAYAKMTDYLRAHMKELGTGHVSPTMHTLSGGLAAWQMGDTDFARFFEEYRPRIMAARGIDGSFTAFPTAETLQLKNNTDRMCGPIWTTASYAILLDISRKRLTLLLDRK